MHQKRDMDNCYRPQYHFTPPSGWMNDPNGLVWHDGKYHLYYQWNPHSTCWDSMHWGHAVSDDLIGWQDRPQVFEPEARQTDYFSGSAVYDQNNTSGFFDTQPSGGLVAVYTHRDKARQEQAIAYSSDKGDSFVLYDGNPVIANPGVPDFRDPKAFWMEKTKCWHIIMARGDLLEFYASHDLKVWEKTGDFGTSYGLHTGFWECPDMFPLKPEGETTEKWIIMAGDSPSSRTQYFIGHFDGKTFTCDDSPDVIRLTDFGYDNYSGQTYNDTPDGRRIQIAWLNSTRLWNCTPTDTWRGMYSIPRELSLQCKDNEYQLYSMPVKEIERYRTDLFSYSGSLADGLTALPFQGRCLDIDLTLRLKDANRAGIALAMDGPEMLEIGYDDIRGRVYVDRSRAGNINFPGCGCVLPLRAEAPAKLSGGEIKLRILLDRCSVEVFINGGERCISSLFYPIREGKIAMLFADGSVYADARAWIMKPIW